MPLNLDAVGKESEPVERSWTERDVLLYALGVGAGAENPTGPELAYTTENSDGITLSVLPTFAVLLGGGGHIDIGTFDPAMLVHGEQAITLHQPLPTSGTARSVRRITGIYDKGKAALVVWESSGVDAATGELLFTTGSSMFIRGEGGFGGDRGPASSGDEVPSRDPDVVVSYATRPDQALLYRLSGDRNPLHSDPTFAARAGFDRPILHGLCTYGFTGRALLHAIAGSDTSCFASMSGRFSRPVFPGETLTIKMWRTSDTTATFQTGNPSGEPVLTNGHFTLS